MHLHLITTSTSTVTITSTILAACLLLTIQARYPSLICCSAFSPRQQHPSIISRARIPTSPSPRHQLSLHPPLPLSVESSSSRAPSPDSAANFSEEPIKRIVLIGGGHAHLQVIKALNANNRPQNWHVTLIDQSDVASYSGMIPGCISGHYTKQQAQISLHDLANWSTVHFHRDKMVDIDADAQRILLHKNHEWIEYDVLSLDIGSASRGSHTPGVSQFAIPTRPIDLLVDRIQHECASEKINAEKVEVVVVGGGAAGIELAMAMRNRFHALMNVNANANANANANVNDLQVTILNSGNELLPYESDACRRALLDVLKELDVRVKFGCRVRSIDDQNVQLDDGRRIAYTHCIWAAGASAHSLSKQMEKAGIAVSGDGWVEVGPTLQSISHDNIFAAGDCATILGLKDPGSDQDRASPPKAGVYAVRSGPTLIENIARYLNKQESLPFDPQDDFLKLIACGNGIALGFRFGIPLKGKWVWELKNQIDQMFVDLFRVENLPDLSQAGSEGNSNASTAQYDEHARDSTRLDAEEGCKLILRRDDDVDFQQAWGVLREMMSDEDYKNEVLSFAENQLH